MGLHLETRGSWIYLYAALTVLTDFKTTLFGVSEEK